jgi:hypothetical protein
MRAEDEEEEEEEWMKQAEKREKLKREDPEEQNRRRADRAVFFAARAQEEVVMRRNENEKRQKQEAMREQARLDKERKAAQPSSTHGVADLHNGDVDTPGKHAVKDVVVPMEKSAARSRKFQQLAAHSMTRLLRVQYVPQSTGHRKYTYHCGWEDKSDTWEPRRCIEHFKKQRPLKWAEIHTATIPGSYPTIKFTGALAAAVVHRVESKSFSIVHRDRIGQHVDNGTPTFHRDAGKLCALNCVVNGMLTRGMRMPPELYTSIAQTDPSLEQVVNLVHRKCAAEFFKPNGINNDNLLDWLLTQIAGVFGVEYKGHCVTWLAKEQVILDTDPRNIDQLPINDNTLSLLGINTVEKVYEICQMRPVRSKKRRRHATG